MLRRFLCGAPNCRGVGQRYSRSRAPLKHTRWIFAIAIGLKLPALSDTCAEALRKALPAFIPPSNPLDLTAQGLVDPDLYRRTLPPILDDDRFASVVLGIILTDPKTTRLKLPPIVSAISV